MGFIDIDKLTILRNQVIGYLEEQIFCGKTSVDNEEKTKQWLVIPFLTALGYNAQSSDVVPEVTADFYKKGEKVDYMLQVNNLPVALIECKKFGEPLNKHINQLFRYFQTKDVHLGILTNGVEYQFFTDSQKENVMDKKPYFTFDISEDDLALLNDYTKENITRAFIPSIVNKRKQLEQQKEKEISDYKSQINELQAKISKQKEEPNVNEQIQGALLFQQLLKLEKLEKENKQLKEKAKPKKEKVFYGHTDLDKQKVPADIARDMVALLPEDVFVPEAKFFDPFCRYGELLIAIKDRLMQSQAMKKAFPDEDDRDDYISDNQLYAFVIDQKGLKNVTRVIHKTSNPKEHHVVCFGSEDVYKKAMKSDSKVFVIDKLKELGQMKFDVVIGNPPYNNDIYLDFVQLGHALSTKCSIFITPAKWQAKGGQKNEDFRKNIVPYMSEIVYYPCAEELFDITEIMGITYYLIDKKQHSDGYKLEIKTMRDDVFHRNQEIEVKSGGVRLTLFDDRIENFCKKVSIGTRLSVIMSTNKDADYRIRQCHQPHDKRNSLCCGGYVTTPTYIEKNDCKIEGNYFGVVSGTEQFCKYFDSYIKTKFVRFCLSIGLCGSVRAIESWRFVPAPEVFDHIFTDQELYEKYKLTDEEINIIESVIKERK